MFVQDLEIAAGVAAALGKEPRDLAESWQIVIKAANRAAYDQICHRLITVLGYTQVQADAWTRGATWQRALGIYESLVRRAKDEERFDEWRTELDYWRGTLKEVTVIELPDDTDVKAYGGIGGGTLSTKKDLFVPDANDTRRGLPTQW